MRIGIVGHLGANKNFVDGQTVKVKSLVYAMTQHAPKIKLYLVDTYYLRNNPVRFLFELFVCLIRCGRIVFLPAYTGRQYMFKTFYWVGKLTGKRFYHDCIAGSLDKELMQHPKWEKYLNSFYSNWMESPSQVERLVLMGVKNASYLPNFKPLQPVDISMCDVEDKLPRKFVVFSRVEKKKGIEDALRAIKTINDEANELKATLDVYGPIQPGSEEWFETILQKYSDIVYYGGVIGPYDGVQILKKYFALLFPTQYYTEGMPGTIVDAMFAGLPVICRRWEWCDNMIISGYNGYSYDFDKPEFLKVILERVIDNPMEIINLKANCIKESEKYSDRNVINKILSEVLESN